MLQDLRFAFRVFRSRPGFTCAAVIPLTLAIACTTAALTLADAVLFRPLGVKDPSSLAAIYTFSRLNANYLSDAFADYRDISALHEVVESATAYVRLPVTADLGDGAEILSCEMATGDYFRTLGVSPALGRALGPQDDRPGSPPAVLIADSLWASRFQRSPGVLGSTIPIGDVPFTVVGVMPRGYAGMLLDWGAAPVFWMPMAHIARVVPQFGTLDYRNRRDMRWLMMAARLQPGASVSAVQAALDVLRAQLDAANPKIYADIRLLALPSSQARFFPAYRDATVRFVSLLVAISAVVLLIACFNLMNLQLARAAAREKETATLLALGASRGRVLQQFVIESVLLAVCAVALGLPLSLWLTKWLSSFHHVFALSLNLNLSPDPRVLLWSTAAGLMTGVATGVAPALRAGRANLLSGMNEAQARPFSRVTALAAARDVFVAAQVACAMVVLVSATLLGGSLRDLQRAPLGYSTHNTLLATLASKGSSADATRYQMFYRALLSELRARAPEGAALVWQPLPGSQRWTRQVTANGSTTAPREVEGNVVSDGFFELVRMPLESGRGFLATDDQQSPPVVILNRTAANLFWPGQDPVGRSMRVAGESSDRQVAGVVSDAAYHPLAGNHTPYFFLPLAQSYRPQMTICVRTPRDPLAFTPVLRRIVRQLDGRPLSDIRTLESQVASGWEQLRLTAVSTSAAGAVGTVLALAGVFAVTAFRVVQQRRQIAIRIALGAGHRRVMTAFALKGLAVGSVGAAAGGVLAVWATGLLRSSLRGVAAPDAAVFFVSAAVLLVLVFAASLIPAWQILRVDPATLLRVQ